MSNDFYECAELCNKIKRLNSRIVKAKREGAIEEVEKILALAKRLGGVSLRYLQEELKELKELILL